MKDIKITNYTTKDWLKQMGVMFCIIMLGQFTLRSALDNKDYISTFIGIVGIVGWSIVYHNIMKGIRKRNPQEYTT